ncbi:hypothetical protein C5167_028410 [Papaver somniferum]|nr:hypothetical protein C5167_028410 [Papaver somniferum]
MQGMMNYSKKHHMRIPWMLACCPQILVRMSTTLLSRAMGTMPGHLFSLRKSLLKRSSRHLLKYPIMSVYLDILPGV